jgi:hypothetical protein
MNNNTTTGSHSSSYDAKESRRFLSENDRYKIESTVQKIVDRNGMSKKFWCHIAAIFGADQWIFDDE